jgi:hypothetical protein
MSEQTAGQDEKYLVKRKATGLFREPHPGGSPNIFDRLFDNWLPTLRTCDLHDTSYNFPVPLAQQKRTISWFAIRYGT